MPYSTGMITNTRATGTAAANVVVSTRNTSSSSAVILVAVFGVPSSTLIPLDLTSYVVPPYGVDIREFFIEGNIAYEVQLSELSILAQVLFSTYGIDEYGNIVTEQRVLNSELTEIQAISPTS
ncbi:hypothetical protein [Paenibacillus pini]|uniref:Uncharacterized protein n=1 Tax=Paenibacillus pini JCM 16418 TaxID=1236976 RepID=W7YXR3_9BACL|nr:hypothetical protein [Paenibacillus pini]GAF09461.1 hypothetical protein JCM16418_3602 [Paenibacillus pini JCM 16418]